jgi:hypothetical protein
MDGLAQVCGEAGKLSVHAVLIHGWCSATADGYCNPKWICSKSECEQRLRWKRSFRKISSPAISRRRIQISHYSSADANGSDHFMV